MDAYDRNPFSDWLGLEIVMIWTTTLIVREQPLIYSRSWCMPHPTHAVTGASLWVLWKFVFRWCKRFLRILQNGMRRRSDTFADAITPTLTRFPCSYCMLNKLLTCLEYSG